MTDVLRESDQGWYYNGINTFHPKSQTTLLIPTLDMLEAAEKRQPY